VHVSEYKEGLPQRALHSTLLALHGGSNAVSFVTRQQANSGQSAVSLSQSSSRQTAGECEFDAFAFIHKRACACDAALHAPCSYTFAP
jgi:hypothetical protein